MICPILRDRKVTLYKDTWLKHICSEHYEVKSLLRIIEHTISSKKDDTVLVYQKHRDPNAVAIFKQCYQLNPYYMYIAITVKIVSDKMAIVTSCYGKYDITNLDMEVYDGR